jgi:hypothetical protein
LFIKNLIQLERKYADILNNEDLTGIHSEAPKKGKKKFLKEDRSSKSLLTNNSNENSASYSVNNSISNQKNLNLNNSSSGINQSTIVNTQLQNSQLNIGEKSSTYSQKKTIFKDKTDSHNLAFIELKRTRSQKPLDTHKKNLELIQKLNEKANTGHFCKTDEANQLGEDDKTYLYSQQRNNYYEKYYDYLRKKYIKDTNNYYTYSKDYLTLSFPMLKESNKNYENYIENKNVRRKLNIEMDCCTRLR